MTQSQALKSTQLENYLNWFLFQKDNEGVREFVRLIPPVKNEMAKEIFGAKGIEFKAPINAKPLVQDTSESFNETTETKYIKVDLKGKGVEIIDVLIGDNWRKDLSSVALQDKDRLEARLYISFPSRTRIKQQVNVISHIANTLGHVDEELDFEIKTSSGVITKNELKMEVVRHIKENKGLIDLEDLWEKMYLWYTHLVELDWFTND